MQTVVHYGIHLLGPLLISIVFFRAYWVKAYSVMLMAMLIDLDHLFATPIFDPNRCSINFHPLHSYYAIVIYAVLILFKKTRLIGLGLLIHILADLADCSFMLS